MRFSFFVFGSTTNPNVSILLLRVWCIFRRAEGCLGYYFCSVVFQAYASNVAVNDCSSEGFESASGEWLISSSCYVFSGTTLIITPQIALLNGSFRFRTLWLEPAEASV